MPHKRVRFGEDSWLAVETSVWDIWYTPVNRKQFHETGLNIYIGRKDRELAAEVLSASAAAVGAWLNSVVPGAGTGLGAICGYLAGLVPRLGAYLALDANGGLDIHIAPHGFQCGALPAADPNVWTVGAWEPIRQCLEQLPQPKAPRGPDANLDGEAARLFTGSGQVEVRAYGDRLGTIVLDLEEESLDGVCPKCQGNRKVDCPRCSGAGVIECRRCKGTAYITDPATGRDVRCPQCGGDGSETCYMENGARQVDCWFCGGDGRYP
ncbi:hypothetical protein NCCP1664_07560 [Zafaria cholistanensis]|uniref:Uncharacterized protein n=1 Tax=Zafaria cholistanensis TaxID=1682741 RepID=A0A5A7NNQ2_9MICC|nr:hypothetical protein [Zafaria cholistanensis]GER22259.1 hypothetical protein NCCP1664_07560 [Zafaria cholistanensis]